MDKQQELAKKIRNAINNTLSKEDITIEKGINAMLSACTQILYGCAGAYPKNRKGTEKDFVLAVYHDVIEQVKGMPDNLFFKEEDNGAGKQH